MKTTRKTYAWEILTRTGMRATNRDMITLPDMLRYDHAFRNDRYPGIVVTFDGKGRYGAFQGKVTPARWESFGYTIRKASVTSHDDIAIHENSDDWYTFIRSLRSGDNLTKLTLTEWLQEG